MFRTIGIYLALLFPLVRVAAQEESGLLPENPKEMKAVEWARFDDDRAVLSPRFFLLDDLGVSPESFSCKDFPLDQGRCASCAGCAVAQAYSIHYAFRTKRDEGKIRWMLFSGSYIYNQIKKPGDCLLGARLSDGLKLLTSKGICPEETFEHSPYTCAEQPDQQQLDFAAVYKIAGFGKVITPDSDYNLDDKIKQLKNAIAWRNPVIVYTNLPKSLAALPRGQCDWRPPNGKETIVRHALVITGYDEHHFQVLNSLGCRWGCNGVALVPADELAAMVEWAFVMNYILN